jgi:hypothetical protein
MFRIPLPSPDTALLLTPRWGNLPVPFQVALLVLLLLIPIGLIVWLYRYELHLVPRSTATGLLLLRLVVLVLLVFLVGLQPVLGRDVKEELPGRVLIAVDRSASMDVADPQRPPVDKLRLARALDLVGDLCTKEQLDSWIKAYEEKKLPEWIGPDEFPNDPEKRKQVARDRFRAYEQVCARVDVLTRTQTARRLLSPEGANLLAGIAAKHKVELLGFAQESWNVKPDDLEDLFRPLTPQPPLPQRGEGEKDKPLPPLPSVGEGGRGVRGAEGGEGKDRGQRTDLRVPLERALELSAPNKGKVLGVVLLTDGQHNVHEDVAGRPRGTPAKRALDLGEQKLPLYPVGLGARQAPPDIVVVDTKAPPAVFKDVDADVTARIKVSGLPDLKEVVVELQRPDGQPPLEQTLQLDGTDRYYNVHFQVRLDKPGTQALTVKARPAAKEIRTDNNSRPVVINVADDKMRVLLIDGEARWEFHYLFNVLQRDRAMQLQSVVFAQPRVGKIEEEELTKAGNPARTLPEGPDALAGFDCIILGDVTPEQLPPAERVRLEKYVGDRGGTLVLLAGKRSLPLAFVGQPGGAEADQDPLLKLLPIEQPRVVAPVQGFPVTLTEEGRLSSFLQMDPVADESLNRWAELPPHYWGIIGKAKPGAVPLAYFHDERVAGADKKQRAEREREQALIVRQNYGFGRVLFVGLESTWRWRYKIGDVYHHRFWSQTIRWAASDKPLVGGNDAVRFGTRGAVFSQGQPVDVVVRLAEEIKPLAADALAGARILRQPDGARPGAAEEAVAVVPLARKEAQPRLLEGQVPPGLSPGKYFIELAIPELADKLQAPPGPDGKPGKLRAEFTVTGAEGDEMVELATNWPLLEELAAKSGGKAFAPENAAALLELLTKQSITHTDHFELQLWQWWGTLALFLVLLTVEWVARKMAGLP